MTIEFEEFTTPTINKSKVNKKVTTPNISTFF
jgi:hypothetical protein